MKDTTPAPVLVVWDRIGDYHRARLAALEGELSPGAVLYADLGGADGLYGWKSESGGDRYFLLSEKPVESADFLRRFLRFRKILRREKPRSLALSGYGRPSYVAFLLLGRIHRCRITLFAESWYGKGGFRDRLKGAFLRLSGCRFLLSGQRALAHFRDRLGVPGERLFIPYSVVDNRHFSAASGGSFTEREPVFLCVARFSPEKDLTTLLEAFLSSAARRTHRLRLLGGGPEKEGLRKQAEGVAEIEFHDWVGYGELPGHYGRARFFVLPSRFEPWGLVVNEAMAAALPVVLSDACGCAPDLARKENGEVFPSGDVDALRDILDRMAALPAEEWSRRSHASRAIVEEYSCGEWARNLCRSLRE